jgi:soluble lytic murein transglycosylase-like protein
VRSSCTRAVAVLAAALLAAAPVARGDIFVTRRPDGTLHITNVPAHRGPGSTVVLRGRDARPTGPSQVITATGDPATPVDPNQSAQVRSLYAATARDGARYARFDEHIREAATLYQIPEALIRAVIKQESDFNPYCVSTAGASGLMQLMPSTAQSMMVRDVFDPRQSILGGTRFLRVLANMFNGDLMLTIAAYNAGAGAVIRYAGIPPYDETQHYVRQVLRYYYLYRAGAMPGQEPTAAAAATTTTTSPPAAGRA